MTIKLCPVCANKLGESNEAFGFMFYGKESMHLIGDEVHCYKCDNRVIPLGIKEGDYD